MTLAPRHSASPPASLPDALLPTKHGHSLPVQQAPSQSPVTSLPRSQPAGRHQVLPHPPPVSSSPCFSPSPQAALSLAVTAVPDFYLVSLPSVLVTFIFFFLTYCLATLGLLCCTWAFSSCGEPGLPFLAVHRLLCSGFSCCGAPALGAWASVTLSSCGTGLVPPPHVGSSQTRDQTHVPLAGRF